MINRCGMTRKIDLFHMFYNAKIQLQSTLSKEEQLLDKEKVETAVSLEYILTACYRMLSYLLHNRSARREFQHLSQRSNLHQQNFIRLLEHDSSSEKNIEMKRDQYLSNLNIDQLSVVGVLNVAIGMASHTMDIYKYLSRTCPQYGGMLDRLVQDNVEEIELLRNELEFHQQRV